MTWKQSIMLKCLFIFLAMIISSADAVQMYTLEPTHSYVEFHYNHMGFSNPSGKWFANGTILLNQKDLTQSSTKITINLAGINTGINKLDEHLRGIDFFNTERFPTATFISTKVTNLHGKHFDLTGLLTLHGITKPVTLHVTENMLGTNPLTKLSSAGFSATTTILRSDFALAKYVPMVSDTIDLNIEVEAFVTPL